MIAAEGQPPDVSVMSARSHLARLRPVNGAEQQSRDEGLDVNLAGVRTPANRIYKTAATKNVTRQWHLMESCSITAE